MSNNVNPKFSIVIPVYNVSAYLSACLESVLAQTFTDFEAICVDDGSTDDSLKILQQYAEKDSRITVVSQENKGVSSARNRGIKESSGEYLLFCDGDDYIEANLLEELDCLLKQQDADIIVFGTSVFSKNKELSPQWNFRILCDFFNHKYDYTNLSNMIHLLHNIWDKCYKSSFLRSNKILFPEKLQITEDFIFCLESYFLGASYSFLPQCLYNYRDGREGSLTNDTSQLLIKKHIEAFHAFENLEIYKKQNFEVKKVLINSFLDSLIYLLDRSAKKMTYNHSIRVFLKYLRHTYSKNEIKKLESYKKLRIKCGAISEVFEKVFSLKKSKDRSHKIFLGIKIKFKRHLKRTGVFKFAGRKSVLIFEPQPHHGECLPSYIKYFTDLGYHVDVCVLEEIVEQNPFIRLPKNLDFNIITCSCETRKDLLSDKKILDYKHILISTAIYQYSPQKSVLSEFPIFQQHKSVYIVEHDLRDIKINHEEEAIKRGRVLTLWNFHQGVLCNPSYFGDIRITPKNVTTFIVVGNVERKRKNHNLLFKAVEELAQSTHEFHVVIIGKVEDDALFISDTIKPLITVTGYLNFPEMYTYMEHADFFLPLFDPENQEHERYITSGVSGSIQLILGFRKVPLIQKKFGDFYGFSASSSIVYNCDLKDAMKKAIDMTSSEYKRMQEHLDIFANEIQNRSKKNLEDIINFSDLDKNQYNKLREHLAQKYSIWQNKFEIISLGWDCLPRTIMTWYGITPDKKHGKLSCPFDLSMHTLPNIIKILRSRFEDYLDDISFDPTKKLWHNSKYYITYNHDETITEKSEFRKRYSQRISNFLGLMKKEDNIFFIYHALPNDNKEDILLLSQELSKLRDTRPYHLIVISDSWQNLESYPNVSLCYCPLPYEGYTWWNDDHFSSCGINYEKSIIEQCIKIFEHHR